MNPQQLEIIESFGVGQAVIAGAGCGKTTTLVAKCIALIRRQPKARFCAVSFTEKSVRDLKESLKKGFKKEGVEFPPYRHWIKTIHGLCSSIIQEFPIEAGLAGGERIILQDEMETLWERSLYLLWTRNENTEISAAVERLLKIYSRKQLESNFKQLRSLISFGIDEFVDAAIARDSSPDGHSVLKDLWFVFRSVFDRFQQWKLKSGALDFNDLERFALKALSSERVRQHYHERFDLVLVDEFQDTNPIQGEILERLVKPGFLNLCIVGDPKQSIYRFRDADVSVFQDLVARVTKKHLLDTNYRSRPAIIEFVNQVCAPVFAASELEYEALHAGREATENRNAVMKLVLNSELDLARYLKEQAASGIDLSEFVILSRSIRREKTQKYLAALDEFNVPYLLGSGGRFYSDPRVQELVAFLKGWISSNQALSQATALRAPWIGVSDAELLEWRDDLFLGFFEKSNHPIAQNLREDYLARTPLRPGQVLEKIWDSLPLENEMELAIATLWQKAETLSSQGKRFEEVVNSLVKAIDDDKIEKEIPPPSSGGMVRIMTIHASKGLQFPRVILLDFEGIYRGPAVSNDLIWNRKKGIHLSIRDEAGDRYTEHPENVKWAELEKHAAVSESKRLFYVAITRPQEQLILAWKKEVKVSKTKQPSLAADDWRTWIDLTVSDLPTVELAPFAETTEKTTDAIQESFALESRASESIKPALKTKVVFDSKPYRPRHSPSEWMVLSECALRYQKKFIAPEWEMNSYGAALSEAEKTLEAEEFRESVAEKGLRVHAHLENEDWEALTQEFESSTVGEKVVAELQEILTDQPDMKVYREIGFEVPFSGENSGEEALVGMMDRLEVNPHQGLVRIIDYKWTRKQKTAEEMKTHYQLQLELYSWAAIQMCGFPVKKLETKLIHFSKSGMNVLTVEVNPASLDSRVNSLLSQARECLKKDRAHAAIEPHPGEYCRYCEYRNQCPAITQNSIL